MIECDRPGALLDGPSVQGAIGCGIGRDPPAGASGGERLAAASGSTSST